MHSNKAAIDSLQLTKAYRSNDPPAVADLTLKIEAGCVFGFLGPNGAGKTTVLKMLLGLTRPSSGKALLFGRPIDRPHSRERVGYLPELFRYPPWLTPREVLDYHAALAGVPHAGRMTEIERVLSMVGLASRAADRTGTFSKGMQQRLGLAVALLGHPRLVFLDEPTSALDPLGRVDVRDIVRGLRDESTTVFINSHLLTEVEQLCDRVAFFRKGRIVADGSIDGIVGSSRGVRIKLDTQANGVATNALRAFGQVRIDGDTIALSEITTAQVPDAVAALVARGMRIRAVIPLSRTLEQRFLELMDDKC
ncbi:MAG TPA: ABC transporter ATP-binding protein [Candidatus Acidoferrum sp.]|nr:ABC transporter ATP-binding protein [Candidatus Acidoferrum sp.]